MTVYRLLRGEPHRCRAAPDRIHTADARRLLTVTAGAAERVAARRDAAGTRQRLRALTAIGHSAVGLAEPLGVSPGTVRDLIGGHIRTVTPALQQAVASLYDAMWDQPPTEHTGAQRRAATAARVRAARNGWPPPMGLDDDQIDNPRYRPRTQWRPAAGACPKSQPSRYLAGHRRSGDQSANTHSRAHAGREG